MKGVRPDIEALFNSCTEDAGADSIRSRRGVWCQRREIEPPGKPLNLREDSHEAQSRKVIQQSLIGLGQNLERLRCRRDQLLERIAKLSSITKPQRTHGFKIVVSDQTRRRSLMGTQAEMRVVEAQIQSTLRLIKGLNEEIATVSGRRLF